MCGIIGYVGSQKASHVITEGLKRLEYRGYDSVGIAVRDGNSLNVKKDKGMVEEVSNSLDFVSIGGTIGLGHTRWATHGAVCKANSHPHADCKNSIILAHNGVIENFVELKHELEKKGHKFASETDSEIIAHLLEDGIKSKTMLESFLSSLKRLEGSYAIVAMTSAGEEKLFVARRNSPLVIGVGKGEMLCASDIPAMLKHTKTFVPLEEGDVAVLSRDGYNIYSLEGAEVTRKQITVDWGLDIAQKGGYPHFMLREINDQKHFINESLASDVTEGKKLIDQHSRIDIVAAGTSYHAGLMLSYLLSQTGKSAQAFIASDYSFVAKPNKDTLMVVITQSGETADVLQAMRFADKCKKLAITNTVGSSVTRLADCTILMNSGPEIGVAATKTFTSQLAVIFKLVFPKEKLSNLSQIISQMLEQEDAIKKIAPTLVAKENVFFIARGGNVPIAYEASLKFKEITYIHSEAYPGGELKHGTLSLITNGVPVIVLAPSDATLSKLFGNLKEAKARGGTILSITNDDSIKNESDFSIPLPKNIDPILYPFALIVPLQLLAYHVSVLRGINPDRPRNLAKSVTVE
ncbi:Glutamine--fructose-6-phosphate aminotransferase [isomerizing] [Candidatus Bilamarchaeum dharawalense]|uniref:Glutamine--fructose-6-phosphate aminotransferase [isomerizing] n=1 Tax=Candidatus Bilamarchaeum dharawalense TaxID=2885759 RepID=A0A5E4LMD6_9ARCH|nr:Glutamine--fructose-6-phosphate aminotransferase [isomerizing] [Candidatus Bilamarchaeum dharawalense]